jgi:hypothetical protein
MALEVIGPGFGRTGTNSLRLALERLGLGPCHHMHELSLHPAQVPRWVAAARGEPVDWEAVFAGYRAQVDWPGARYWRTLAEVFPDARVVLSVRPSDAWYRSFAGTIAPELHAPPSTPEPLAADRRRMQRETIAEQVFGGRLSDRAHAIAVFERHNAEVRRTIAPERLLVFDVTEGWEPLCRFLGVPVPPEPFPRTNSAAEFHDGTWTRKGRSPAQGE